MKILILDDDLNRHTEFNKRLIGHDVTNVYTSKEAIQKLKEEIFDIVFLDHDLGGQVYVVSGENTGYEVAVWLSEHKSRHPNEIYVHSLNPVGSANIKFVLPNAVLLPFAWTKI